MEKTKISSRNNGWQTGLLLACFFELLMGLGIACNDAQAVGIRIVRNPHLWALTEFEITGLPVVANPFDPELMTVDGILTLPSGSQVQVPAFWYQNYQRSLNGSTEVLHAVSTPVWRLRYCPSEVGTYQLTTSVSVMGTNYAASASLSFGILTNDANLSQVQGYARVGADKQYFETTTGAALPLMGQCVCWPGARGTYDYDNWFGSLNSSFQNSTRIWMAPWAFGLEEEPGTLTNYRLDHAWQLDYVMGLAEKKGIRVMLCLDYHGMFETVPDYWGGNNLWTNNPYNKALNGPCLTQNDFFTNAQAQKIYQKRLRYLVARYGYSPSVLAWEFLNEIDNVYSHLVAADVAQWHANQARWLKQNDPYHHMITTSLTGSSDRAEIWTLPDLDFANFHSYGQAKPSLGLAEVVKGFLSRYKKPVLVSEFGVDWRGWFPEKDPYWRGMRQGVMGVALSGAAGTAMPWYWENLQTPEMYAIYNALHQFTGNTRWGKGKWTPAQFKTSGNPPYNVGAAISNGPPFSLTLPLDPNWGSKLTGKMAVVNPQSDAYSAQNLNSFVHGTAHPELRIPMVIEAWLGAQARLILHLNSVSDGSIIGVRLETGEIFSQAVTNRDHQWNVNDEYNIDIPVNLLPGKHRIEILNKGVDWYYLDWVRLENAVPSRYQPDWQPSPLANGVVRDGEALVYVVNPAAAFPASATNAILPLVTNSFLTLTNWPVSQCRAFWYDARTGIVMTETLGYSGNNGMVVPLPDWSEDLLGRLVTPIHLLSPRLEKGNVFSFVVEGAGSGWLDIEQSIDLTSWQPWQRALSTPQSFTVTNAVTNNAVGVFFRAVDTGL